jgi:hypothetical protein
MPIARSYIFETNMLFLNMAFNEVTFMGLSRRVSGMKGLSVCYATLYLPQLAAITSLIETRELTLLGIIMIVGYVGLTLVKAGPHGKLLRLVLEQSVSRTSRIVLEAPTTWVTSQISG